MWQKVDGFPGWLSRPPTLTSPNPPDFYNPGDPQDIHLLAMSVLDGEDKIRGTNILDRSTRVIHKHDEHIKLVHMLDRSSRGT